MIPKFSPIFYTVFFLFLFSSCREDKVVVEDVSSESNQFNIVDTLFGNLSTKQQYFQHLVIDVPETFQLNIDSLTNWVIENEPGVIRFNNWNEDSIVKIKSILDTSKIIEPHYLVNYFDFLELPTYPFWEANPENRLLKWLSVFQSDHSLLVDLSNNFEWTANGAEWMGTSSDSIGIKFVTHYFKDKNVMRDFDSFNSLLRVSNQILELELSHFDTVNFTNVRNAGSFEGLFMVNADIQSCNGLLAGGVDYFILPLSKAGFESVPFASWGYGADELVEFNESTARILDLKRLRKNKKLEKRRSERVEFTSLNLLKNSLVLLNASKGLFPLDGKVAIYSEDKVTINSDIRSENKLSVSKVVLDSARIQKIANDNRTNLVVLSDTIDQNLLEFVGNIDSKGEMVVCFSNVDFYEVLKNCSNLVFFPRKDDRSYLSLPIQQLTGRLSIDGGFVLGDTVVEGQQLDKSRLARTSPEFAGVSSDSLKKIDVVVNGALNGRAFPGCQVIAVKNGCVIYDKSYGYHTYDRQFKVTRESMYDVASLTKVVSTTMVGMKLYEMEGYLLEDSLSVYLPDSLKDYLEYPSTIRNITFQELFIHKSGLPAGFPVLKYMQYTSEEVGRFDKYFCDAEDTIYSIEVAENFFLEKEYQDSMWLKLNQMWLDKSKPYKYSDVNMNTLYFIFKSILHNNPKRYDYNQNVKELKKKDLFVEFLYDSFYKPLEMVNTRYKPLNQFNKNKIVPTERERYWRKQLLQGHVHDPNAALYGGIAGNAGIFSTTNDLAVLGQMLLNKGEYNNKRYLTAETVNKFTTAQSDSHRGLGWNKPSLNTSAFGCADDASPLTFGHTGFTGTCIWMDPVEQITYVFLSNRVHPSVNNRIYQHGVRARIHQAIYDGILD